MMPPTMPLTIVITSEPSTDHANPSIVTPTEKNDSANHDASCMNSQLITSATSPNAKHRGLANGVHAGQNRNHNARRDGKN